MSALGDAPASEAAPPGCAGCAGLAWLAPEAGRGAVGLPAPGRGADGGRGWRPRGSKSCACATFATPGKESEATRTETSTADRRNRTTFNLRRKWRRAHWMEATKRSEEEAP